MLTGAFKVVTGLPAASTTVRRAALADAGQILGARRVGGP